MNCLRGSIILIYFTRSRHLEFRAELILCPDTRLKFFKAGSDGNCFVKNLTCVKVFLNLPYFLWFSVGRLKIYVENLRGRKNFKWIYEGLEFHFSLKNSNQVSGINHPLPLLFEKDSVTKVRQIMKLMADENVTDFWRKIIRQFRWKNYKAMYEK